MDGRTDASYRPINIYCSSCGAPARFDIARQAYLCPYCGSQTGIDESLAEKRGFRKLHRRKMKEASPDHPLVRCLCSGCAAELVFPEGEALTTCAFCGRSLARKEYLGVSDFPEVLIPFKVTQDEARERLLAWCDAHRLRREAADIRAHAGELTGFYLPYELVKGPTNCSVKGRGSRIYHCRGFLEGSFVNTSRQLDNLLLDGTEPYELDELREFGFSYLAGQRVKMRDTDDKQTAQRVAEEIAADYEAPVAQVMETRGVELTPSTDALVRLSAVLPAYYLRAGDTLAAVNGQTGKVAVREATDRFLLPWWLLPIFWTLVMSGVVFGGMRVFGAEPMLCAIVTGVMALFLLITLFTAYSNAYGGQGRQQLRRRVFTSDESRPHVDPPEFYELIDGQPQPVILRFTSPGRVLRQVLLALVVVFLPLILAFVLNGFSAEGLNVAGAAVWLCIAVPVAPVYLLNFGRIELYEHPTVWVKTPAGGKRRWRGNGSGLGQLVKDAWPPTFPGCLLTIGGCLLFLGFLVLQVTLVLHWDQF